MGEETEIAGTKITQKKRDWIRIISLVFGVLGFILGVINLYLKFTSK